MTEEEEMKAEQAYETKIAPSSVPSAKGEEIFAVGNGDYSDGEKESPDHTAKFVAPIGISSSNVNASTDNLYPNNAGLKSSVLSDK